MYENNCLFKFVDEDGHLERWAELCQVWMRGRNSRVRHRVDERHGRRSRRGHRCRGGCRRRDRSDDDIVEKLVKRTGNRTRVCRMVKRTGDRVRVYRRTLFGFEDERSSVRRARRFGEARAWWIFFWDEHVWIRFRFRDFFVPKDESLALKIFCWKWKNWVDRLEFACTSENLGFSRILFHKSIERKNLMVDIYFFF